MPTPEYIHTKVDIKVLLDALNMIEGGFKADDRIRTMSGIEKLKDETHKIIGRTRRGEDENARVK